MFGEDEKCGCDVVDVYTFITPIVQLIINKARNREKDLDRVDRKQIQTDLLLISFFPSPTTNPLPLFKIASINIGTVVTLLRTGPLPMP